MDAIAAKCLESIEFGEMQHHENMAVVPLMGDAAPEPNRGAQPTWSGGREKGHGNPVRSASQRERHWND